MTDKKSTWILAVMAVSIGTGLAIARAAEEAGSAEASPDQIMVTCNGKSLTSGELNEQLEAMMVALEGRVPPDQIGQFRPRLRDQLQEQFIMRILLSEAVEKKGIQVDEAEVKAVIEKTKAALPEGMTLDQVRQMQGMDEKAFQQEFRLRAGVEKLIDAELGADAAVTDEEISTFYKENEAKMSMPETVEARHILLKFADDEDEDGKAAKKKEIQAIRKQLQEGADFAELAKAHSDCPSSQQGGNLGQFGRGQMVAPFEEAAFSQDVDAISDVVETRFGYHLIQVTDKAESSVPDINEMRPKIEEKLLADRRNEKLQGMVTAMRDAAKIDYPDR